MARLQKKKSTAEKTKRRETTSKKDTSASKKTTGGLAASAAGPGAKKDAKTPNASHKAALVPGRENFIQKGVRFFREVRVELRKVTWPSRKQAAGYTVVVIILVFIISVFLGMVDFGLSKLVQAVLA
ncbi:MAG: preprotein translocase subunit SecE [Thermodesulfobacteriota bacterium]|nr:preprotein translocase subunit SecE [Thermodesulfobacteriota bacterium]